MSTPIAPTPTSRTGPYFAAARRGLLLLQRCSACSTLRVPEAPACPTCFGRDSEPVEHSGRGVVHASTVVRWAAHPGVASWVPYVVALIDLDNGPRVVGRILDQHERVLAGTPVSADFIPVGDDLGVVAFRLSA